MSFKIGDEVRYVKGDELATKSGRPLRLGATFKVVGWFNQRTGTYDDTDASASIIAVKHETEDAYYRSNGFFHLNYWNIELVGASATQAPGTEPECKCERLFLGDHDKGCKWMASRKKRSTQPAII